ncbi:MAG: hypothetical protein Q7T22_11370 [Serpentinimonas sp.]|nr:hypothetical protein [Serpentinimonas sp.]MDO9612877.1 hypothetical protein [Serpentinimonas sp.]
MFDALQEVSGRDFERACAACARPQWQTVLQQVTSTPMELLCISAVTEGELAFGLAKRPGATTLAYTVGEFLRRIEPSQARILPA